MGVPRPLAPRFWAKVDVGEPDECWPWTGYILPSGYGRIAAGIELGGPPVWVATRVAYTLTYGPIPEGAELDHVCHTRDTNCVRGADCPHRRCVNPGHLEAVTHEENAVRRDARVLTCLRGHAKASGRGRNGRSAKKCRVCHRIKMQHWRDTGVYCWPERVNA